MAFEAGKPAGTIGQNTWLAWTSKKRSSIVRGLEAEEEQEKRQTRGVATGRGTWQNAGFWEPRKGVLPEEVLPEVNTPRAGNGPLQLATWNLLETSQEQTRSGLGKDQDREK